MTIARRILVVDDEPPVLVIIHNVLTRAGHEVMTASGGGEALECLSDRERRPDLVVIDRLMPPPDGAEIIRIMRADEELSTVPVIMISGFPYERAIQGVNPEDIDAFIGKPFSIHLLLEVIEGLLEKGRRGTNKEPAAYY